MIPPPTSVYLEDPLDWRRLLDRTLRCSDAGGIIGLDTETIGCDPDDDSAVWRSHVAVWSIGIPDGKLHPRGYKRSEGFVLPPAALDTFADFFASERPKTLHNRRYDQHTLANDGYELRGGLDTVDMFRVLVPGLDHYGIKYLIPPFLGYGVYGDFRVLFTEPRTSISRTKRVERQCSGNPNHFVDTRIRKCETCGEPIKSVTYVVETVKELTTRRLVPVWEICGMFPGTHGAGQAPVPNSHPLWPLFVNYAGLDAIGSADLIQLRTTLQGGRRVTKVIDFS